ncbi:uncharacterized protein LOC135499286 isoform X2 [Lineus longissimus]|uniref:uncharacterized protein LOC135499286 isoform X2 n=1 Tax=Lineus longissimus TaxID=88925 RepID=UPI002B4F0188
MNVWEEDTIRVVSNLEEVVQLSSDARCDSMGHNAKYDSRSLHDTKTNAIICTELVVSTEPDTKKSAAMEVLGLSRALGVVDDYCPHLEIKLITDGHAGVSKYVGENPHPDKVTHYLDIWHG